METSPFPGMDPFLEPSWLDLHQRLITYSCDQLQDRLPSDLCARLQERVVLEDDQGLALRSRHPDLRVVEQPLASSTAAVADVATTLAAPSRILIDLAAEPVTQSFIEIVDSRTRSRVVTCIELVSPSNKLPGHGRELYLEKQTECRAGRVNLVEIDLTRAGDRRAIFPWLGAQESKTTYLASVRRGSKFERIEIHEFPLDRPLKPIAIPLRETDADVVLELQPLIETAYHRGRCGGTDYTVPLEPPLTQNEIEFVDQRLRQAGKG